MSAGAVTLADRLSRWFFTAAPARHLALVRITIGAYAVGWLVLSMRELMALGRVDESRFRPVGVVALLGIGAVDTWLIVIWWALTLAAACAVVSGRGHRVAGPTFAGGLLLLTTYQNSWGKLLHTENLLVVHAFVLATSPAADALVVGVRRRRVSSARYGWPLRTMAIATVLAYFAAGVTKLRHGGLSWMTTDNLQNWVAFDLVRKELFGDPYLSFVVPALDHAWLFAPAAIFIVAVELAAPVALLGRRAARLWVAAAWTMHSGVLVVMAVGFPYQLVGAAFLPVLYAATEAARPASRQLSSSRSASARTRSRVGT